MIALSAKDPAETVSISFDFDAWLAADETISSSSMQISVEHGTDPDYASMLTGVDAIDAAVVSHLVRNGVDGATYRIASTITTNKGQVLKLTGLLPIKVQE